MVVELLLVCMVWACFSLKVLWIASSLPDHVVSACWYLQTSRSSRSLEAIANALWLVKVHLDNLRLLESPWFVYLWVPGDCRDWFFQSSGFCIHVHLLVMNIQIYCGTCMYDLNDRFFRFIDVEVNVVCVVCSYFDVLLVWSTTEKTDFSGCRWMKVSLFRGCSFTVLTACLLMYDWGNQFLRLPLNGGQSSLWLVIHCFSSLLVGVRLRKLISPVAVKRRSVFFCGWLFSLSQHAIQCTTVKSCFSSCRVRVDSFPRSRALKWGYV